MSLILDDATIRSYLLGELPESQAESLEDEYFGDPEVLERVRDVEDDLLDDYVAGELAGSERKLFERRYLATPAQRERLVAASALRLMGSGSRSAPGGSPLRFEPGAKRSLGLRFRLWPVLGSLAALLLISIVALRWLRAPTAQPARPRPPVLARVETPQPSSTATPVPSVSRRPEARPLVFVLALAPLLTRGEGAVPAVRLPPRADEVLLEFRGEPGALPAGRRLSVALTTVEGRQVWTGPAQRASDRTRPALLATARLRAVLLEPDDYIAALSSQGGPDESPPYSYFFRILD